MTSPLAGDFEISDFFIKQKRSDIVGDRENIDEIFCDSLILTDDEKITDWDRNVLIYITLPDL